MGVKGHLEQLEAEYKGTETTREEMCGVKETYHATPDVNDEDLLRGEAMDASPRTETALLAEMADTPATGVGHVGFQGRNSCRDCINLQPQHAHGDGVP